MKKSILGNIFLIKLVLIFFSLNIFADVEIEADRTSVQKGEDVTLTIRAQGQTIEFPTIEEIGGNEILSRSDNMFYENINGKTKKIRAKSYRFIPKESLRIPSFVCIIDGKEEKTKHIDIEVLQQTGAKEFTLELKSDKKSAYISEPIELSVVFKSALGAKIVDLKFAAPKFADFWVKDQKAKDRKIVGDHYEQELVFTLFPQKEGVLKIDEMVLDVGQRSISKDPFGMVVERVKYTRIFSNSLEIESLALPQNTKLYGTFNFEATIDKQKIKAGEAVSLELKIGGEGNFDDLEEFDLKIEGTNIFKDKSVYKDGVFKQKFAILSDNNFTIPSFELKYFDKIENKNKTLSTNSFFIEVEPSQKGEVLLQSATPLVEKEIVVQSNPKDKIIFFIVGFMSAILFLLIFWIIFKYIFNKIKINKIIQTVKDKNDFRLNKLNKKSSEKNIFEISLPLLGKDKNLDYKIKQLEENIYFNGKNVIDKKEIIEIIKKK